MHIDFPYHYDNRGRTAETTEEDHIRDLIEQVLFTSPGERVNRPSFGCGLNRLVFEPAGDELAATIQLLAQGALQQYLGRLIQVDAVRVESEEATLKVTVQYLIIRSQQRKVASFTR